ncbi:tropomyosin-1, isoforms 33/34-like [Sorghum bicolor]|uniref:tropomyosin-1, isoforms 33/34-like n=1 Tax=Sorghum bicolor TaxID=4558 RepID=UPI000B424BB4|nr:tropomyosin-1, isoforms 33/34-like [Sorghum bicolor]|eukprot:XP_021321305.1 tropomyosin-1, isoforms 33/34-like [Sorghum bicolor]
MAGRAPPPPPPLPYLQQFPALPYPSWARAAAGGQPRPPLQQPAGADVAARGEAAMHADAQPADAARPSLLLAAVAGAEPDAAAAAAGGQPRPPLQQPAGADAAARGEAAMHADAAARAAAARGAHQDSAPADGTRVDAAEDAAAASELQLGTNDDVAAAAYARGAAAAIAAGLGMPLDMTDLPRTLLTAGGALSRGLAAGPRAAVGAAPSLHRLRRL